MLEAKEAQRKPRGLGSAIDRKSLGQHVFEHLREAIIHGEMAPGDRLVESRLAGAMDISRTPVREAIHKLEREGLLKKLPKGGFTVVPFSREDIKETFGIRCVLEMYAASLAASNCREEDLLPLEDKIQEFQRCLDRGLLEDLPRINTQFHNFFYSLSRSPKLIKMINDLNDQIYRFRMILLKTGEWADASNRDHRKMVQAIRKRDTDKVQRVVKEHLERGQRILLRALEGKSKGV